jgi:Acyl-coenzyme A:6-aminopenicillanic acid acyl-transferase
LLACENYDQAIEILKDSGVGVADGCSLNMLFLGKEKNNFFNIELAPAMNDETQIDILPLGNKESMIHCNHYLRMNIKEYDDFYMNGTKKRYETLNKFPIPMNKQDVIKMLGDTSDKEFWIFRCQKEIKVKTICVGIFDLNKRTWSIYKGNPKNNGPVMVLHLNINES